MGIIWHKVWRDLACNKLRTLLVVLSTAVGVFALGLVFGMSGVILLIPGICGASLNPLIPYPSIVCLLTIIPTRVQLPAIRPR